MTGRDRTGIGLRSERGPVLLAIMLAMAIVAVDATVLATAVPSIVRDLGGFSQFPWLFSIYLLTQAVTVPLYGKLADVLGRRPVIFFGIAAFLFGSVLCSLAWSMPALIAARAVQGIGAGAVQPIALTMVGDLYSLAERARVQGYLAGVWGAAAVIGPALGGLFSEYLTWRWIFVLNLPIGALAFILLAKSFHETVVPRRHRLDLSGAGLLMIGLSLVILGLLEGGVAWAWDSPVSVGVFAAGGLTLVAFGFVERRAAEPVVPLWVFGHRVLVGGFAVAMTVGAVLIGLSSYVPTYVQGVLGTGALVAGFALSALSVGWPLSATFSGRFYLRIGFRNTAVIGSTVIVIGAGLLAFPGLAATVPAVAGACFVIGLGLGLTSAPTVVAVQSAVDWQYRGVVTATNMFSRNLGSAVGAAVFGALANITLADRFAHPPAEAAGRLPAVADAESLLVSGGAPAGAVTGFVRSALDDATHQVFLGVLAAAVLGAAVLWLIPRHPGPASPSGPETTGEASPTSVP